MDHSFHLRPSDSFLIGSRKIALHRIKSDRRVTLKVIEGEATTTVELVLGSPLELEPSVTLALDPNTSRASMSAVLVASAPPTVRVTSPQ